jgi:hypothetical protein
MRRSTVLSLPLQIVFPAMDMLLAEIGFFSSWKKIPPINKIRQLKSGKGTDIQQTLETSCISFGAKISLRRGKEKKWRSFLPKF